MNLSGFAASVSDISLIIIVIVLCYAVITLAIALFKSIESRKRTTLLEEELHRKNQELHKTIEELKATQVRLIESGKVTAAAALSAGILHQISQPITAIHGFVRFMKQEMPKDNTFYRPVCLMDEQSVYLKEMLNNLMALIRHRKIEKVKTDVNAVLERSLNLLTDELRIRRVHWDKILQDPVPAVLADPVHLQQVFMNISVNACEALGSLPRGQERSLHVTTSFDTMKRRIRISFADNGPGIPEEIKAHIFEPFFSTKTTGAGIGLALCHDLIREHGGGIEVQSGPGGTTFVVVLPIEELV
ncbi:MAG: hypothetical protein KA403_06060 [Candidatus Omnitrophica bacterium]|nr:hypothetical protein [Candidatus Omnitrophota bacterium]